MKVAAGHRQSPGLLRGDRLVPQRQHAEVVLLRMQPKKITVIVLAEHPIRRFMTIPGLRTIMYLSDPV
jgi:hypothetical protein